MASIRLTPALEQLDIQEGQEGKLSSKKNTVLVSHGRPPWFVAYRFMHYEVSVQDLCLPHYTLGMVKRASASAMLSLLESLVSTVTACSH